MEMLGKAISQNDQKIAYIAPTNQQTRDIAWAMLKHYAGKIISKTNESRLELTVRTIKGGTSKISLKSWESVENLRGLAFDFLVIDEVASMRNWWENWQEVLRPTLTDSRGGSIFISTPKGYNHFYDLYTLKDPDYKSFHFTSYDNPYLDKTELDKARKEVTDDRFAQEYMADFRKTEGLVYREFDRFRHVFKSKEIERVTSVLAGVDFGFSNPCGIVLIKRDYDNHFWVTDEWYRTKQTTPQIIEVITNFKPFIVYPDPEDPGKIAELQANGINCREVNKSKNSVINGIDIVRELFKQGRLHISEACKNLIMELETYHYPEKKSNQNESELPVKEDDHLCDALRYVLMTCNSGAAPLVFAPFTMKNNFSVFKHSKHNPFY